ncbi:MAG: family 43 glycosylhydrolase, partial [Clostridia bacterium]|nr:family 43 glycosylhydrolase [Clostridia bacterium]
LTVCAAGAVCLSACGDESIAGVKGKYVELPYDTGVSGKNYNTDLFYRNDQDIAAPDPGVTYVPEGLQDGGYYYMYNTESTTVNSSEMKSAAFWVTRSKDLNDWEMCGKVNAGFAFAVTSDSWMDSRLWAPECYYDENDGMFYLYFTAASKQGNGSQEYSSSSVTAARTYICVAKSASPMGPFEYVTGVNADGETLTAENPQINFRKALGLDYDFGVIDVHLFEDGGKTYMYFCESRDVPRPDGKKSVGGIWVAEMKDRVTPDYSTLTKLAVPGVKKVTFTERGINATYTEEGVFSTAQGALIANEEGINEGPFMIKHGNKYYLTYSQGGYMSSKYSVWQAVGDSPMGPFTKLEASEGGLILGASPENDWLVGTAHHCFTYAGDELMIVYHGHLNPANYTDNDGRGIAVDRVLFVDGGNGYDVMIANGPTKSLQYLSESISGYKNLAPLATVKATGGEDSAVKYLTDGLIPFHTAFAGERIYRSSDKITITLTFEQAVEINSVMIFNGREYRSAFAAIDSIAFRLSEIPAWFNGVKADYAVIQNLAFPGEYFDDLNETVRAGAAATAAVRRGIPVAGA